MYKNFYRTMKKILNPLKNFAQNFKDNFKKTFKEYKEKPKSKRKSFILGFACVLATFGVALSVPALSAVAQDIPKRAPNATEIVPSTPAPVPVPVVEPQKEFINTAIPGVLFAIHAGAFAVGIVCGCVLFVGILHLENSYVNVKKH